MFGLAGLAAPLISNVLGSVLGGLSGGQGAQGSQQSSECSQGGQSDPFQQILQQLTQEKS
jgi:hypothetical protein